MKENEEAYKTIGKLAEELSLEQHVIRFWETKFREIRPKKVNNRRYYSPKQAAIVSEIKHLLHDKGYTIIGAKAYLKERKNLSSTQNENIDKKKLLIDNPLKNIKKQLQNIYSKIISSVD